MRKRTHVAFRLHAEELQLDQAILKLAHLGSGGQDIITDPAASVLDRYIFAIILRLL